MLLSARSGATNMAICQIGRSARQQSRRMQSLADAVMGGVNAGLVHAAKADPDALRRAAYEDRGVWVAGGPIEREDRTIIATSLAALLADKKVLESLSLMADKKKAFWLNL